MSPRPQPSISIRSNGAAFTLPLQLQQTVPSCAQPCLESYINSEYTCAGGDASCLCLGYSSGGFTLGEFAYGCFRLNCEDPSTAQGLAQYNICSAVAGAAQATHSTVTLPVQATSTANSGVTTTTIQVTQTSSVPGISSGSSTTMSAVSATSSVSSDDGLGAISTQPSSTTTSATTIPVAAATADKSGALTTGQAVGVSVGVFGAVVLILAVILFGLWCKRRGARGSLKPSRHSYDFIDESTPRFSPYHHGIGDSRIAPVGFAGSKGESMKEKLGPHLYGPQKPIAAHSFNAGFGRSQKQFSISPESQKSQESMRTVSQLLPEKPGKTPPQPVYRSPRLLSTYTTGTVFEEEGRTPRIASPAIAVPLPARPKPVLKTVPKRPSRPEFTTQFSTSPEDVRQPSLSLEIPRRATANNRVASSIHFIPPPPIPKDSPVLVDQRSSSGSRIRSTQSSQPRNSANSYLPNYYTGPESRTPPITPISPSMQTRRPVPATIVVTKPTYPPRAVRSTSVRSAGSDTSFESTDPDDITPPEDQDNKRLSAVPEATSPVSNIRYPKVPRSSSQAIPRSPKPIPSPGSTLWALEEDPTSPRLQSPKRDLRSPKQTANSHPKTPDRQPDASLQGTTLAAKRRGDTAATSLENGLHIQNSSHSHSRENSHTTSLPLLKQAPAPAPIYRESPLKGYGRQTTTPPATRRPPYLPQPTQARKPSYAGSGYGAYDTPFTPPEMRTTSPKVVRTDREVVLNSPLWEPKLTPSRRGEDLFLSVSLGSPLNRMPITPGPASGVGFWRK